MYHTDSHCGPSVTGQKQKVLAQKVTEVLAQKVAGKTQKAVTQKRKVLAQEVVAQKQKVLAQKTTGGFNNHRDTPAPYTRKKEQGKRSVNVKEQNKSRREEPTRTSDVIKKRKRKNKKEKKMTKCSPTGYQCSTYSSYCSYDDFMMVRRSRGWPNPPRPSMDSFRSFATSTLMLIGRIRILGHCLSFLYFLPLSSEARRHFVTSVPPLYLPLYTSSVQGNNALSAPRRTGRNQWHPH